MAFEYQSFATLGVNLNRQNYGPLDISNVFLKQADLDYYTSKGAITTGVSEYWYKSADSKVVPYPYAGQVVALVEDDNVQILKLTEKEDGTFDASEVGKVPLGDDKTIEVTSEGVISIKGFTDAGNGAQLTKNASGELEWVVPSTETVDGLKTTVESLKSTVGDTTSGLVKDVDELQTAIGDNTEGAETGIYADLADNEAAISTVSSGLSSHIDNKENPHAVTAAQVGLGNVTNDAQVKRSEMGVANGVATLDENGLVPASQLPSYVDDVIEVDNYDALPATGESGKIYVDIATGKTYRWGGTTYAVISDSIALGTTTGTAYEGSAGKANADAIAVLNGNDTTEGSVAKSIKDAIEALDVDDSAETGKFVTAVSEADGKITVSREALIESDIPELSISKIKDLQDTLDAKALDADLDKVDERLANAEKTIATLVGGEEGSSLGTLAYKSEVSKTELAESLKTEIEGKLDASEVTGDLLTHNAAEFATAAQGAKADSAIQKVKVNGNELTADANKAVDVTIVEGSTNGTIAVNGADVAVKGLGSAAYVDTTAFDAAGTAATAQAAAEATAAAELKEHTDNTTIHVTAEDKAKWNTASDNAGSAVQSVVTGTANGTIAVDGTDVAVKGLGSAAYTESSTYATKAQGDLADSAVQNLTVLGQTLSKDSPSLTVEQAKTALGLGSAAYADTTAFDAAGSAATAKSEAVAHANSEIAKLLGDADDTATDNTVYGAKAFATDAVTTLDNSLAAVAKSGKASDVTIEDTANKYTATTVEGALAELAQSITDTGAAGAVTVEATGSTDDYSQVYVVKQNGLQVGASINIPKDMVVSSGSVVTLDAEDAAGHAAGTYLKLVLANSANSEVWIPADSLIEYVTSGSVAGDMVVITVDEITHKVTASITDGTVTKAKLHTDVQASLDKADAAVQSVTVLGKVLTDGTELTADEAKTILGLGSAAYEDTTAFDAAGSAATAEANAIAADEKVILQKVDVTASAEDATSFSVDMTIPETGYSFVTDSLAKVIVNGVVYVVDAAASVTVDAGYGLEADDEVYVEFRIKKTA